jgi:hypothetical protein
VTAVVIIAWLVGVMGKANRLDGGTLESRAAQETYV